MMSLDKVHRLGALVEKKNDGYYVPAAKFLVIYDDQIVHYVTPGTPSKPKWKIEGGDDGDTLGYEKPEANKFRVFKEIA